FAAGNKATFDPIEPYSWFDRSSSLPISESGCLSAFLSASIASRACLYLLTSMFLFSASRISSSRRALASLKAIAREILPLGGMYLILPFGLELPEGFGLPAEYPPSEGLSLLSLCDDSGELAELFVWCSDEVEAVVDFVEVPSFVATVGTGSFFLNNNPG